VPFGGRHRIVDFVLSNLINSGLLSLYVLVQYKSQSLIEHLRLAWRGTGIVSDDSIRNVARFVQETRKTQENITIADITDWSFAKKADEQLKR
jgi:ADP-glucose pyrophosphorylase